MDRYTITLNGQQIRDLYDLEPALEYKPRFNAAPTQLLPVLTVKNPAHFSFYHWGNTPQWANKKKLSTKQTTLSFEEEKDKPLFQSQLAQNRCLIPVDGFYQWRTLSKKRKIAYRGYLPAHKMFFVLGIWEQFEDEHGNSTDTFRIITIDDKEEKELKFPFVILPQEVKTIQNTNQWQEGINICLEKHPQLSWSFYPVSPKISDTTNDYPELINEVPPADQYGNYQLFR